MGLFENPYRSPVKAGRTFRSRAHKELSRQVARKGVVLLQNEGILPLSNPLKSIAVIGPNADNMYNQLGDYTAPQERKEITTVLDGIRNTVSASTQVTYVKGCAIRDRTDHHIPSAAEAAQKVHDDLLGVGGSRCSDFKTQYVETRTAQQSHVENKHLANMK